MLEMPRTLRVVDGNQTKSSQWIRLLALDTCECEYA